jgi:bifunctional DNase/RNase
VTTAEPPPAPPEEADGAAAEGPEPPTIRGLGARFIVVDVLSVVVELPSQYPVVTLQENESPYRQLSLPIGLPEGVAMAHAFRGVPTTRPLTHELFAAALQRLRVDVVAVRLVGRTRGTYLGELDLMGQQGREVLACRPTDGIILALRMPVQAPILVDDRLFGEGDVAPG